MIECRGISKSYRKGNNTVTPLEALDLNVRKGEFLALMGPSGSGKTTLLNLLSGIDSPTSGSLTIAGINIAALSRRDLTKWRAKHVGYIFQLYHLVPVLTLETKPDKATHRSTRSMAAKAGCSKEKISRI